MPKLNLDIIASGQSNQKLKAVGTGSYMVIIPRQFMRLLEWEGRDDLIVKLDYATRSITVTKK